MAGDLVAFERESANRIIRAIPFVERMYPHGNTQTRTSQYADPTIWLPFRNDSGETCPGRSIVRITDVTTMGSELGGDNDDELYIIEKPNDDWHQCYGVTEANDVADDEFGLLTFSPVAIVAYDSGATPARGEGYGPKEGEWAVFKNYPQTCHVQGIFDATNKYMRCHFGPIMHFIGKTTTAHAKGATEDIALYAGTPGSETDTGIIVPQVLNRFIDLDDDVWVQGGFFNGNPELTAGECSS